MAHGGLGSGVTTRSRDRRSLLLSPARCLRQPVSRAKRAPDAAIDKTAGKSMASRMVRWPVDTLIRYAGEERPVRVERNVIDREPRQVEDGDAAQGVRVVDTHAVRERTPGLDVAPVPLQAIEGAGHREPGAARVPVHPGRPATLRECTVSEDDPSVALHDDPRSASPTARETLLPLMRLRGVCAWT